MDMGQILDQVDAYNSGLISADELDRIIDRENMASDSATYTATYDRRGFASLVHNGQIIRASGKPTSEPTRYQPRIADRAPGDSGNVYGVHIERVPAIGGGELFAVWTQYNRLNEGEPVIVRTFEHAQRVALSAMLNAVRYLG